MAIFHTSSLLFFNDRAMVESPVIYASKAAHDDPLYSHLEGETLDIFEFIARADADSRASQAWHSLICCAPIYVK